MSKKKDNIPFLGYNVDEFQGKFLNQEPDDPPQEEFTSHITPDPNGMSAYFNEHTTNHEGNEFF
jgi:hypothetical protein